jgi:hypothetical protein
MAGSCRSLARATGLDERIFLLGPPACPSSRGALETRRHALIDERWATIQQMDAAPSPSAIPPCKAQADLIEANAPGPWPT